MDRKFKVKVNSTFDFDISKEDVSKLNVVKTASSKFHILLDNIPLRAEIIQANFNEKQYTVKVNNNSYTVDISNALDHLINDMGFSVGTSKQINIIKAPMPGLILDLNVQTGQKVKENDTLLILEAMKMENSITSPRDGIVKFVAVSKGDAVDKGVLLVEFE